MKRTCKYVVCIAIYCFSVALTSLVFAASDLEGGVQELAQQISKNMTTSNKKKIAIIEFSNLDGNITAFGQFLAEELITQLFMISPGQFEVVERRQLMKVLNEQKLTMTGLLDAKAMESVGKILGIEAIVTGSLADLGNDIKVNARLIGIDTAKVFAVASTKIPKVGTVANLFEKETASKGITPSSSVSSDGSVHQRNEGLGKSQKNIDTRRLFQNSFLKIVLKSIHKAKDNNINVVFKVENISKKDIYLSMDMDRRQSTVLLDEVGKEWEISRHSGIGIRSWNSNLDTLFTPGATNTVGMVFTSKKGSEGRIFDVVLNFIGSIEEEGKKTDLRFPVGFSNVGLTP